MLLLILACDTETTKESTATEAEVLDVRVPVPDADPNYVDLVSPEIIIEPYTEKMYCIYLTNHEGEIAVHNLESSQGKYGHHVVLLTTTEPQPEGTVEDCTDSSLMYKFRSFILPDTPLGDGYGIKIPADMQYVMQIHYVNTGDTPILTQDVARMEKIAVEDVSTWTTTLTTNSLTLSLAATGESSESFDCEIPEDVELLVFGGHMHEKGSRFEGTLITESDEQLYLVDPWMEEYRDAPPVSLYFENPKLIQAGTKIRTACQWNNDSGEEVTFPAEMCSAFGYIAGTQNPVHCEAP